MATETLEFKLDSKWEKFARECSWAVFVPEVATDKSGQKFMRRRGSSVTYKEDADGNYICASCNSDIEGATVAHPIWDGPFPMSGSGKVHNETVPYCPKCEQKPNYNGSPIQS